MYEVMGRFGSLETFSYQTQFRVITKTSRKVKEILRHMLTPISRYVNFGTSSNSNNTRNILSRIRNGLVTALNEHSVLPKLIVIVPDDDVINHTKEDFEQSLEKHL